MARLVCKLDFLHCFYHKSLLKRNNCVLISVSPDSIEKSFSSNLSTRAEFDKRGVLIDMTENRYYFQINRKLVFE